MKACLLRIWALMLRYFYLHRRSVARSMEIFFWPTMGLLVWGFLTRHLQGTQAPAAAGWLIGGMIFWEILYRAQQSISLSITEEFWVRNIINLFLAPVRVAEIVAAVCLIGVVKSLVTMGFMIGLAYWVFDFSFLKMGVYIVLFYGSLLIFGWAVGLFTMGLVFRHGRAGEALIWGIPFLIQPVAAVFYPVSVLPGWLQWVSLSLPASHVFEGMRSVLETGSAPAGPLAKSYLLTIPWMLAGGWFFGRMLARVRKSGALARQVME